MASLKDIARECQVSVATVSKALNDHADISEERKALIRRKAEELGYRPNLFARTLKTNRSHNIGVLFTDEAHNGLTHDYFGAVLDSFKVAVEEKDYDLTFLNCNRTRKNRMTYLEHARYRGFDGVVVACIDFTEPEVLELVNSDLPVVTIDYIFNDRLAVISDNGKGMEDLLTFVYRRGHRRIAYIHGADSAVTRNRLSGFYRTAQRLGLEVPDEYVLESDYRDTEGAAEATQKLLDLKKRPTCILYPDDFAALGGLSRIRENGLAVPQDISVAGYDGIRLARHASPKLTTLYQDTGLIGRYAAEKLIDLIENPKTALRDITVVEGRVLEGQTVRNLVDN
ncbi:MAG TPA: LacI family transcriptional regulator [Candidatus Eisenbergiella merdavium]|uniref:LacI family transcriptional regulator n=1 Tax=Candidatus Eisenbergiella merdavium TaxID=2838551 RepID=A0A9D2NGT9_9FIRM|nr:LacI family transcriptional regulator [Candidatus Eisenbergiella merdavium]